MSKITATTKEKRFPVAPDLYGLFFEDISHAGDGGLYPEMLRNRSFEDSILPEGCTTSDGGKTFVSPTGWIDEFNNGEGMNDWIADTKPAPTPVPAWYAKDASMTLDQEDTLNNNRKASLKVHFEPDGEVSNIGYNGVPQEAGKAYLFYMFAKAEKPVILTLSIKEKDTVISQCDLEVRGTGWVRYDAAFVSTVTTGKATFVISCKDGGDITIGFSSLMPADTFNGHHLRRDLVEKLRDINPAFLRFPGGCIVEGFSMETVWYFRNMVGPVWERPSHWLLWHYRSTNGLGYHEYLQLCEDLNIKAMYVCNCGMTCQARKPHYFNEEEQTDMLEDILAALEYALGSSDTKWGSLRAKMGHEAPFKLEYLEIGNENHGPEYEWRFHAIRKEVLARYPQLKILANEATLKGDEPGTEIRLQCDIVDDHYYNMPEFYAENIDLYDTYDRKNPGIFVGEFSVNQTFEGQHRAAVAEAMFMVGLERNQDVIRLASYAPLFQHVSYGSWYPNLLIFDNYRSYAIPSYYAWRLFGGNRGENVVASTEEVPKIYYDLKGLPSLSGDYNVRYRNVKYNGKSITPSRNILGKIEEANGEYQIKEHNEGVDPWYLDMKARPLVTFGTDEDAKDYSFEAESFVEEGNEISLGMMVLPKPLSFYDRTNPNPLDIWTLHFLESVRWVIKDGKSYLLRGTVNTKVMTEATPVSLTPGAFHKFSYQIEGHYVNLYLDDELLEKAELPSYPALGSVVTDSDSEVIIKIVNFGYEEDTVEITLDCDVESEYTVGLVTGQDVDENSLDTPEKIVDTAFAATGASKRFTYQAPALSINVLRLKKCN